MQFEVGYTFDGRFKLIDFLGSGTYGEVWLAHDIQTDIDVAVKIYISMDSKGLEEFKKEFQVSYDLNHTNLLHAYFLEVSRDEQRPYLVMPYCPYGSVMKSMGKMSEKELWKYIKDVSSGLSYLHSQTPPIIHQDIKPDNILITKNKDYVISDFGISQQARSTMRRSVRYAESAGSIAYMGPERWYAGNQYGAIKASDIWSFGVTIYELAVGELPFCGLGGDMLRRGADLPELPSDRFSSELNAVMQSCLAKETWERPTAKMLEEYSTSILNGHIVPVPWMDKVKTDRTTDITPAGGDMDSGGDGETDSGNNTDVINNGQGGTDIDKTRLLGGNGEQVTVVVGTGENERSSYGWYVWLISAVLGFAAGAIICFLNIL